MVSVGLVGHQFWSPMFTLSDSVSESMHFISNNNRCFVCALWRSIRKWTRKRGRESECVICVCVWKIPLRNADVVSIGPNKLCHYCLLLLLHIHVFHSISLSFLVGCFSSIFLLVAFVSFQLVCVFYALFFVCVFALLLLLLLLNYLDLSIFFQLSFGFDNLASHLRHNATVGSVAAAAAATLPFPTSCLIELFYLFCFVFVSISPNYQRREKKNGWFLLVRPSKWLLLVAW